MVGESHLVFCVLGSGSSGNAVLVSCGETTLLVDAGLSLKETRSRMGSLDLDAGSLDALLITHEHGDHIAHAARLGRNLEAPVFVNDKTREAAPRVFGGKEEVIPLPARPFTVGSLEVTPVPKGHDATDPVAFLVSDGESTLGIFTDLGHVDATVGEAISRCTALVMESNHDPRMLAAGPYPPSLRRRVGGRWGHISNEDSARALRRWTSPGLEVLVLAHLSSKNNHAGLVKQAFIQHLGQDPGYARWISHQNRPTPLFSSDGQILAQAPRPTPVPAAS